MCPPVSPLITLPDKTPFCRLYNSKLSTILPGGHANGDKRGVLNKKNSVETHFTSKSAGIFRHESHYKSDLNRKPALL